MNLKQQRGEKPGRDRPKPQRKRMGRGRVVPPGKIIDLSKHRRRLPRRPDSPPTSPSGALRMAA